jgi:hypothetical protein
MKFRAVGPCAGEHNNSPLNRKHLILLIESSSEASALKVQIIPGSEAVYSSGLCQLHAVFPGQQ